MPRRPIPKKPTGSHPCPIDWERVNKLLIAGCYGPEVAASLGISPDTLYNRAQSDFGVTFTIYRASKVAVGDSMLRDKQFSEAMRGDRTMLIWLGKQRLAQKENPGATLEAAHAKLDALFDQIKLLYKSDTSAQDSYHATSIVDE